MANKKRKKNVTFEPMTFSDGSITIGGGYATKERAASVHIVDEGNGINTVYVKIARHMDWLAFAALGKPRLRSEHFDEDNVMDYLRDKVRQYSDGELSHPADNSNDECDPMDAIGTEHSSSDGSPNKTKGRGSKRVRYYKNHALNKVVYVAIADNAPAPIVHQVRLFITDRRTVWLHKDDVELVVRMLANQADRRRSSSDA